MSEIQKWIERYAAKGAAPQDRDVYVYKRAEDDNETGFPSVEPSNE